MACIFGDIPRGILNYFYQYCWQDVFIDIIRRFRSSIFFSNWFKKFLFFQKLCFHLLIFLKDNGMSPQKSLFQHWRRLGVLRIFQTSIKRVYWYRNEGFSTGYVLFFWKILHWTWPTYLGTFQEGFGIICTNFVGKMYL